MTMKFAGAQDPIKMRPGGDSVAPTAAVGVTAPAPSPMMGGANSSMPSNAPMSPPSFNDPMPLQFNASQPSNWAGSLNRVPSMGAPLGDGIVPKATPVMGLPGMKKRRVAY